MKEQRYKTDVVIIETDEDDPMTIARVLDASSVQVAHGFRVRLESEGDEVRKEIPSCEQEGKPISEQSENQTDRLLLSILLRLEELTLMYLTQSGLSHSSGSELYRDLLRSTRNSHNRKDS